MHKINNKASIFTIAAIITVLLQGCAGNVKLSEQDRAELQNIKEVKVVHRNSGWPGVMTPLGVLASDMTFGLSDDWTVGHKLIEKFNIEDPSKQVKENFLNAISKKNMASFTNEHQGLSSEEVENANLKSKYSSGYVLKIEPLSWQILYYPLNWAEYQMFYRARAELIRLDDDKVLWSSNCKAYQDDSNTAPTFDQLTSENSTVLKKWMDDSTARCARELADNFLL